MNRVRAIVLLLMSAVLLVSTVSAGQVAATPVSTTTPTSPSPEVSDTTAATPDNSTPPSATTDVNTSAPPSLSTSPQIPLDEVATPPLVDETTPQPPVADTGWTAYTPETPSARLTSSTSSCASGRFNICEGTFYKEVGVKLNGVTKGEWGVQIKVRGVLDGSATTVTVGFEVRFFELKPLSTNPAGILIYLDANTSGSGGIGDKDIETIPFRIATGTSTKTKTVTPPTSVGNNEVSGIHFTYNNGYEAPTDFETTETLIRCDNNHDPLPTDRLPGCVNVFWTPTISFTGAGYPNISANIQDGQTKLNGLGVPGITPLVRTRNDYRYANQAFSCSDSRTMALIGPRPEPNPETGEPWSCDEYPFASSTDGGRADGVIKWVPKLENDSQGGTLGGWYSSQRLLEGDWYYVQP